MRKKLIQTRRALNRVHTSAKAQQFPLIQPTSGNKPIPPVATTPNLVAIGQTISSHAEYGGART